VYNGAALIDCPRLTHLNLSLGSLTTISESSFSSTPELETLDAGGSPLTIYPMDVLSELTELKEVTVDNYKLCCQAMLPEGIDVKDCPSQQVRVYCMLLTDHKNCG
jgi:hypothetical protein